LTYHTLNARQCLLHNPRQTKPPEQLLSSIDLCNTVYMKLHLCWLFNEFLCNDFIFRP
jgi:hypothetical protein